MSSYLIGNFGDKEEDLVEFHFLCTILNRILGWLYYHKKFGGKGLQKGLEGKVWGKRVHGTQIFIFKFLFWTYFSYCCLWWHDHNFIVLSNSEENLLVLPGFSRERLLQIVQSSASVNLLYSSVCWHGTILFLG